MHVTTVSEKKVHKFETGQGEIYGKIYREKREGRNDIISKRS